MSNNHIYCCGCGTEVDCVLKSGKEIYPHRPDLYNIKMYECPHCHNRVGIHKGTTKAFGCIPTPEIKRARMMIHGLMDPLWRTGKIKRGDLYRKISHELGHPYHNGEARSLDELRKVYKIVSKIKRELNDGR